VSVSTLAIEGRKVAHKVAGIPADLRARRDVLRQIERIDPEAEPELMTKLVLGTVFGDAFFHGALFTVAYWRQVAVETIAPIIARRGYGDTLKGTEKRTNDTLLFFGLMYRDGYSTPEGQKTIDRLSAIHKTFDIPKDDFRYTLATLCYEPVRIPELLGVKGLTEDEQRAIYLFWTRVGRRWGVDVPEADHPDGQRLFAEWFYEYERKTYKRSKECIDVAIAMQDTYLDRFAPGPLRPIGVQVLRAMSDPLLLDTVDMPPASAAGRRFTKLAIDAYIRGRRLLPGPPMVDQLCGPWARPEYGTVPPASKVGPTWAANIQV
jgi:hypothetical protein